MERELFEAWVAEALDALPEAFRDRLENVEVVVEDWPDRETLRQAGVRYPAELLGFYHGIPQTQRTRHYGLVLPDKISIYRRPIELQCRTLEEIRDTVHHVVRHEIAHHFGISDERLRDMGAY
ncbi:MAG TPA: metallopeptidase family protein [Anaerolineae bacterium]|nr:metallopeptidase family protein [Anaerolineae bacterium]HQI85181.1 metallopeptidase family protein [Anaerolineae bacterium]